MGRCVLESRSRQLRAWPGCALPDPSGRAERRTPFLIMRTCTQPTLTNHRTADRQHVARETDPCKECLQPNADRAECSQHSCRPSLSAAAVTSAPASRLLRAASCRRARERQPHQSAATMECKGLLQGIDVCVYGVM